MSLPNQPPDLSHLSAAERATRRAGADGRPVSAVSPALILTTCALGFLVLAIVAYVLFLPEEWKRATPEQPQYKEVVLKKNPLREQAAAIDGMTGRYLAGDDDAYVKKIFVQNDEIIRYQIIYADLVKEGLPVYPTYLKRREPVLELLRLDTLSTPLLKQASSIYVDVYDQNDEHVFSYDLVPGDVWE